jgi:hypothetical protein
MAKWVLATATDLVEWYEYDFSYSKVEKPEYRLSKTLRLSSTVVHASKESAKGAAIKLGLKTWRYVSLS